MDPRLALAIIGLAPLPWTQDPKRECTVQMPRSPSGVIPGYRDCEVDRVARLQQDSRLRYLPPESMQGDWICERVEMVFVVDSAGRPDLATVHIDATTRREWAVAVLEQLPNVRYRPALLAGRRVRQVVRYTRSVLIPKVSILSGSRIPTSDERWKIC